jgi:preprotein translocase subunit SecE
MECDRHDAGRKGNGSMATKTALASNKSEPNALDRAKGSWQEFTHFLTDVRGEMRKVVTPSRKEVEATTTVVLIAVFLFGLFFFVVDKIFDFGLLELMHRLGGIQQ